MKLKTRARYAVRSMVEIARSAPGGRPVSLERVARRTGISRRYLEQLTRGLREASLLTSVRGRGGGYLLAAGPEDIKLGQIIEAVTGPVNVVDCVARPELCLIADICECRLIYRSINEGILRVLNEYSLADLAQGLWLERVGDGIAVAATAEPAGDQAAQPLGPCGSTGVSS